MNRLEIKIDFHQLIDSIDNESLLNSFYKLIKKRISSKEGKLWNGLTKEEQEELILSFEESERAENLISLDTMKKKHKKWL